MPYFKKALIIKHQRVGSSINNQAPFDLKNTKVLLVYYTSHRDREEEDNKQSKKMVVYIYTNTNVVVDAFQKMFQCIGQYLQLMWHVYKCLYSLK